MIEADRVLSTPLLNSSSIQNTNPPPEALAESVDSFSHQPDTGRPASQNLISESPGPAGGLSRRNMLAGLAVLPAALQATAEAAADPIYPVIDAHRKANAAHWAAIRASEGTTDWSLTEQPCHDENHAFDVLIGAPATTLAGLCAKLAYLRAIAEGEEAWMLDDREGIARHLIDSFTASLRNVGVLS